MGGGVWHPMHELQQVNRYIYRAAESYQIKTVPVRASGVLLSLGMSGCGCLLIALIG